MADEQDKVTPEEKLLNVIQSGGEKPAEPEEKLAKAVAAPVVQAAAPAAAEPVQAADKKPALKLASQPEAAAKVKAALSAAAPAEAESEKEVSAPDTSAAESTIIFSKKKSGSGTGLKTVNGMLVAGIMIMLCLSGFETFQMIKAQGAQKAPSALEMPEAKDFTLTAEEVQQAYRPEIWWIAPDAAKILPPDPNGQTPGGPRTPWGDYMRQNIKLMGISLKPGKTGSEVILMDSSNKKMYFVRLGDSFAVEGVEVKLDDLEQQRARFTDGRVSVELK